MTRHADWDNAIPDGCNTGVMFRALLAVNTTVLLGCWTVASDRTILVQLFLDHAMLVEWGTLAALLGWCAARKAMQRARWPAPAQWLLGAAIPPLAVGLLLRLLAALDALVGSAQTMAPAKPMLLAGAAGLALQYCFHLRARAFSPALAEARLQALQARIHPHFLFNSLNAVLAMIREQPRQAETALEDLAELFRVLMQDGRGLTTLAREITLCRQYLAIEKLRLGERLQVQWDLGELDEAAQQRLQVPVLLLQPLLENAVRYGVEPARGAATVSVRIARTHNRLQIAVANPLHDEQDGAPDAAPSRAGGNRGNHMALENIRERLALLYDVEAELSAARVGARFEVTLRLPAAAPAPQPQPAKVLP